MQRLTPELNAQSFVVRSTISFDKDRFREAFKKYIFINAFNPEQGHSTLPNEVANVYSPTRQFQEVVQYTLNAELFLSLLCSYF